MVQRNGLQNRTVAGSNPAVSSIKNAKSYLTSWPFLYLIEIIAVHLGTILSDSTLTYLQLRRAMMSKRNLEIIETSESKLIIG